MIIKIIATFFYLGNFPFAPGTVASLVTLALWSFLPNDHLIQLSIILILFIIGVLTSTSISKELKHHDPSEVVIDEVVGMTISLFMLPQNFILYALSFIIFRGFDILKPSFIFYIQDLPLGWGIMMDDVIAGLLTLIIVMGVSTVI